MPVPITGIASAAVGSGGTKINQTGDVNLGNRAEGFLVLTRLVGESSDGCVWNWFMSFFLKPWFSPMHFCDHN